MAPDQIPTFGRRLRAARNFKGVSQRSVADFLGVSIPYVSDIENDRRLPWDSARIMKVAEFLGADAGLLLQSAMSARDLRLDMDGASPNKIAAAMALVVIWETLTDEQARAICKVATR